MPSPPTSSTPPASSTPSLVAPVAPADDVRARLLSVAGPIFANRGFDGATIRELCRAASANVAAIGYHFGDKMGLYLEVVRDVRKRRECNFPLPDDEHLAPESRLQQRVHLMLSRLLLVNDEQGWETQLLMREMQRPTTAFTEMVRQSFRPYFEQLCGILADLMPPDTTTAKLHQMAFSVVGQCLYYRVGNQTIKVLIDPHELSEHFTIDALANHITQVTLVAAKHS